MRLKRQRLTQGRFAEPAEVVEWLGAVQAQDYGSAKWAIGLRTSEPSDRVVEAAFDEGRILRTHVLRPTWHIVAPEDIRWLLELTAPRVKAASAYMCRQVGLDSATLSRTDRIISKALEGGRHLTRIEIGTALAEAGIEAKGVRLIYVMMRAELDRVVCSGPRRGKQLTYALLEERAPPAEGLKREEALAELVRRYFTGHGPATIRDLVWWSGLTVADAKAGLKAVASTLSRDLFQGETYWSSEPTKESEVPQGAILLPNYDELLVGYSSFDASRRGGGAGRDKLVFNSPLIVGGRVAGTWKRALEKAAVTVRVAPFKPLSRGESEEVEEAAELYGRFIGVRAACIIAEARQRG